MTVSTAPALDREWLADIAGCVGTPVYVYSLSRLRRRIEQIRNALPLRGFRLFFATMANDEPEVLRAVCGEGVGACVNSLRHWELAQRCGFAPGDIQFTSSGIPRDLMCQLAEAGVACNLDSASQVEQWLAAGGCEAGLRLNCGALAGLGEADSDRLGMDESTARQIARGSTRGCLVAGVHMYAGTNFLDATELVRRLSYLFEFAADVRSVRYVNIGGGVGVDYTGERGPFDLEYFGEQVGRLAEQLQERLGREIEVIFEPGRGLIAESGVFVTRVTDVKCLRGRNYAAVDGSVAIFPRPLHHPRECHRVIALRASTSHKRDATYTVVGRTTYSRDILAHVKLDASLATGDLLAFCDAGAYSRSMGSRFLGQDDPKIFVAE